MRDKTEKILSLITRPLVMLAVFVIVLAGITSIGADSACSASVPAIPSTTCDGKVYESMNARAWLEVEREVTQNQNYIPKPDSVMEYTCLNEVSNRLAMMAPLMMSGTIRWRRGSGWRRAWPDDLGNATAIVRMDLALIPLISAPMFF